jgi:hypothetical protein
VWIFTESGFYSVVKSESDDDVLIVRTRFRKDLDRLRRRYLPQMGPTVSHAGSDYQYRAVVFKEDFAKALDAMARAIDYQNFKSRVSEKYGKERHDLYMEIWGVLRRAALKRNRRGS